MKKIYFYAMAVAALVCAASCNKESETPKEEQETLLSLSEKELAFGYEGGTKSFKITANKANPSVSVIEEDKSWVSLSLEGNIVSVSVSENTSEEARNTVVTVSLEEINKRVRIEQEGAPSSEDLPIVFRVPSFTEFSFSRVYKVMCEGKQIAQVCREYLSGDGIDNQAVVAYPVDGEVADITKGFVICVLEQVMSNAVPTDEFKPVDKDIHGGTVSFDAASNTVSSYTAGTCKAGSIGLVSISKKGEFKTVDSAENLNQAELVSDVCSDADGNCYGIVKIGSQYWMDSDLKSTTTKDGIKLKNDVSDSETWMSVPAYCESCFPELAYLYNAVACGYKDGGFTDNISPAGFTVPSNAQFDALTSYLSQNPSVDVGSKLKVTGWDTWGQFFEYPTGGNNISGFSSCGVGYGNADGSLAPDGNMAHVFYITSTPYDGGLGRYNVNQSGTSFLLQPEGGCALGYAVRSIRR